MLNYQNERGSTIRQDFATPNNHVNECHTNVTSTVRNLPEKSITIGLQQSYIRLFKDIGAAVMLSQAVYWQRKMGKCRWYKTQSDWASEIGLSRRQQEKARSIFRDFKPCFWLEEYGGTPRRLYFKVDLDVLSILTNPAYQESTKSSVLQAPYVTSSKSKYDTHYSKLNQKIKAGDFSNATSGIDSFLRRHLDVEVIDYE